MLESFAGLFGSSGSLIVVIIVFVLFLIIAFKIFKVIMKTVIIAILAALFPAVARFVFNMNIPVTIDSMLWFAVTAVAFYFIYLVLRGGYKIAHFAFGGKKKKSA